MFHAESHRTINKIKPLFLFLVANGSKPKAFSSLPRNLQSFHDVCLGWYFGITNNIKMCGKRKKGKKVKG